MHTHAKAIYIPIYIYMCDVCVCTTCISKYIKILQITAAKEPHFAFEILKHLISCCIFLLLCPCPVDAARCSGGVALGVAVVGVHAVHAVHAVAERSSSWLQMSKFCGNTCLCVAIPCTIQYNTILHYSYNIIQHHNGFN